MRTNLALLAGGAGFGAALMYFLDPNRGRRRRAYLRDQAVHAGHVLANAADKGARDLRNRAVGTVAAAGSRFRADDASDEVIVERVRAAMGRMISHPHAVRVECFGGRVTLTGPILAGEGDRVLRAVIHVRGVKGVEDHLERHAQPGDVSALQGASRPPSGRLRASWPPALRLLAGAAGGGLAVYGAVRRDVAGAAMGAAGVGLLARAATNLEADRLTGIGSGHRGIDLRKSINIAAPPEEVFAFCAAYENWPRFMAHVREIKSDRLREAETTGSHSHWVVDGPAGVPVSWDAEVTEFVPNELLAWKSVEGSMIEQSGTMRFDRNPDGTTRLDVRLSYNPPAGAIGHAFATLLGANPKREMDEDFVRLKSLIESGKTSAREKGKVTRDELAAHAAP
jgi:uncharacterized membrane protein